MKRRNWFLLAVAVLLMVANGFARVRLGVNLGVAPVYQGDYREVVCKISGKNRTVASSGCGAACASMAIHARRGKEVDPTELFRFAWEEGLYAGEGLSHRAVSRILLENGVSSRWIGLEKTRILAALYLGFPVIAHMGPEPLPENGHYILLVGVTSEGEILVNDPASRTRTGCAYPLEEIFAESRTETPFCICG